MSRSFLLLLLVVLGVTTIAHDVQADGDRFIIQVRTDATSGTHFDTIRTDFFAPDGVTLLTTVVHNAIPGRDYALGVRVAEFVTPFDPSHAMIGRTGLFLGGVEQSGRPWRFTRTLSTTPRHGHPHGGVGGSPTNIVITILLTNNFEPLEQVFKVATLESDNDASGTISPGDYLRYTIPFTATHDLGRGSVLRDFPEPHNPLIPQTVTTSHGIVFRGNLPSDTDVEVRLGPVPMEASVSVSYLVRVSCVKPEVINQGTLTLKLAGSTFAYDLVTDDPTTLQPDDPTIVPVDCGQGDPPPMAEAVAVFPQVIPQSVASGVIIEGSEMGTAIGPPIITMNGISAQTEVLVPSKDQDEVVVAMLTAEMTAKAGVIPFSLTPADPQFPVVNGFIQIHPALETAQEIAKDYNARVADVVGRQLSGAIEAFSRARNVAHMDPISCEALKAELVSDLQFESSLGAEQIIGKGETALQQASATNATEQELQGIVKTAADGVELQDELMQQLVNKIGLEPKKPKKKGLPPGLICPDLEQ